MKIWIFILALLWGFETATAVEHPTQGAVVAAQKSAAHAGITMLHAGGNAFDAAAATALALGVVEPGSSGIGGGGFFLLYIAKAQRFVMIDARETAPQLAGDGTIYRNQSSIDGPQSAGIPGLLAGVDHLLRHYGRLTRAAVTAPAIALADQGFVVEKRLQSMIHWRGKVMNPAAQHLFLHQPRIHQPALAQVLRRYARLGVDDFYRGQTAGRLVADMKRDGGLIRRQDLDHYRAIERAPVQFDWQGYHIVAASLPSSGGLVLKEMFAMLAHDDLANMAQADRVHLLTEVMKRAYRDRNQSMGDSDFVTVPNLTAPERMQAMRASITMNQATPASALSHQTEPAGNGRDTTHFSVIDHQGNMVSATLSINYGFGSGYVSPSTGILLNDEMDDFATQPGKPNAYGLIQGKANKVVPHKRMLSSMTPTIITGPQRTLILGTPGGSRIITMVALAAIPFMLHEGAAHTWINRGRFHHQLWPDVIQYEQDALTAETMASLQQRGHHLKQVRNYGNMEAILWNRKTNNLKLLVDQRGEGKGLYTKPTANLFSK